MSEFMQQNAEAAKQYLAFLAQTQDQVLETAKKTPVFQAPEFPTLPGQPEAPSFVKDLPTQRELTEAAFNFSEKLMAQQKSFIERYFDIAEKKATKAPAPSQAA